MTKQERLLWLPKHVLVLLGGSGNESTVEERESLVRGFQSRTGLTVDGWPGRKTLLKLLGVKDPGAPFKNRKELVRVFGEVSYDRGKGRSVDLDDRWELANIRRFTLPGGRTRQFHKDYGEEFAALLALACKVSGYSPKSIQTFNPRRIGGEDRLSMHAYAIAFDVDPTENQWGGDGIIRKYPLFYEVFEWAGWTWGGRWSAGKGDDMHFQRCGV